MVTHALCRYLMVSSSKSSRLFRCDPQCTNNTGFVLNTTASAGTRRYVCRHPAPSPRRWGDGLRVYCAQWMPLQRDTLVDAISGEEAIAVQEGRPFYGGLQRFSNADNLIHVAGTYPSSMSLPILPVTSWVWYVNSDASPTSRSTTYAFDAGVQVVGPPAFNLQANVLFAPVHDHRNKTVRLRVYRISMQNTGQTVGAIIPDFYVQLFSQSYASSTLQAPHIPGFAVRMDTGAIVMVDEQETRVHVLACASGAASCALAASTHYATARYKDVEFVGGVPPQGSDPLNFPAKLFLTTLENPDESHAALYVQCAKCQGGGITASASEAKSEADCYCPSGYMVVKEPNRPQRCEVCSCRKGQFLDVQSGVQLCTTGRETSMPGASSSCLACVRACELTAIVLFFLFFGQAASPALRRARHLGNSCKGLATARRPPTA